MDNTNIPINWDGDGDTALLGSLFPQGASLAAFPSQTEGTQPRFRRQSPLANSPLSKNGQQIKEDLFGGAATGGYKWFEVVVDQNSAVEPVKIVPIVTDFYYDWNGNNQQDIGESTSFTLKLFISKDRDLLKTTWENTEPDSTEMLLFLEDNSGDLSATTLFISRGTGISDDKLMEGMVNNSYFSAYVNEHYKISTDDLQELLQTGKVESLALNFVSVLFKLLSYTMPDKAVTDTAAKLVKKLVDGIRSTCLIEEKSWNPEKAGGQKFIPKLLPDISGLLDEMDDEQINKTVLEMVKSLQQNFVTYDAEIRAMLGNLKIPVLVPFPPIFVMFNAPDSIEKFLLDKYDILSKAMSNLIRAAEGFDFSDFVKESANILNAFLCGLWNGFVDAVCGLISLIQFLFEAASLAKEAMSDFKTKGQDLLEQIDDIIGAFSAIDFGEIIGKLATNFKEALLSPGGIPLVQVAYFAGVILGTIIELVIEIVAGIVFTGGVVTVEAILAKLAEIPKALGNLIANTMKGIVKAGEKTLSALASGIRWLLDFLRKGTSEIKKIIDEIFAAFRAYGKDPSSRRAAYSSVLFALAGPAERALYKRLAKVFYKRFKDLLDLYTDIKKLRKAWKNLNPMVDLLDEDIQKMYELRKALLGEDSAANVAQVRVRLRVDGKEVVLEYQAFSGRGINKSGFCESPQIDQLTKKLDIQTDELMSHYKTDGRPRFYDSEHKILDAMDEEILILNANNAQKVEVLEMNVKTLYAPCDSCKKQILVRSQEHKIGTVKVEATRLNKKSYVKDNTEFKKYLKKNGL